MKRVTYQEIEEIPRIQVNKTFKQHFQGSAPAPFIGRFGYPRVNIGILSPQFSGEMESYDSPKLWSEKKYQIADIVNRRFSLVNSRTQSGIKEFTSRIVQVAQDVAMAKKSAEVEVSLQKVPRVFNVEKEVIPYGPASEIQQARVTSNPSTDTRIERVVYDTDLKAAGGILNLYKKGLEENILTKLISVGSLGIEKNRKLVPTRWSITAVDDTIGKQLIKEVKDCQVGDYTAYLGGSWGNYYLLLFFPEVWSFELFETYLNLDKNPWSEKSYKYSTDYENYSGRVEYAKECAGGYYAARLPVLETMKKSKRQGSCLALRFITAKYNIPLGVWVCREAARKSINSGGIKFSSRELMLKYAEAVTKRKFGFNITLLLDKSKLLTKKQMQLNMFQA